MAGELGSTASMAASAHDKSSAACPKYRQAAASSPTTFPPKGAWEIYKESIFSFFSFERQKSSVFDNSACKAILSNVGKEV